MMAEWGIPFDHIEDHWTDRQFYGMYHRLVERKQAEADAIKAATEKAQAKGKR